MGSFGGHVIPATLLFVYGFFLSLHSMHTHHLLSHPHLNAYIHPPTASKLLSTHSAPRLPTLSRMLLNRRLQNIAYMSAILLAGTHAAIELILWDGLWQHMTSLQHSTMYFLVILCALVGLGMDTGMLPYTARYVVGICFWLCGFMFYSHAQEGLYNESIHKMVAYLFWAAGTIYIVYSMLLAACFFTAARIGSIISSSGSGVSSDASGSGGISPVLLAFTSTFARLTSMFIMLAGSWLFHIAFAMYSPFALSGGDIVHPDHDAHTLYLELSWHFLAITVVGMFIETYFRQQTGEWGAGGAGHARRIRYERVGVKSASDEGWNAGAPKYSVNGEEDEGAGAVEAGRSKRNGSVRKAANGSSAVVSKAEKRPVAVAAAAVDVDEILVDEDEDEDGEYNI